MTLRHVIGEEAFAIATEYGRTMRLQHDDHVRAFNFRHTTPLYDSELLSTRRYWRLLLGATETQASDPRAFADVIQAEKEGA